MPYKIFMKLIHKSNFIKMLITKSLKMVLQKYKTNVKLYSSSIYCTWPFLQIFNIYGLILMIYD